MLFFDICKKNAEKFAYYAIFVVPSDSACFRFVLGRLALPERLPFRSQKSIGFFTSPKLRSRPAGHTRRRAHFFPALLRPALIIKEPKFYLREYEPRKNSGIRFGKRTEGGAGSARFRGAAYST